ncbi:hypothetical protein E8E12_004237 [Didymella heteroderae]|uniref:Uncharacterized protein n=1 Tax=Didymella heteroderae TaxID=1769908 RepID=A0A9P4WK93_9PLEO|nr:hypothetical protein E8E12_004237 [Didymella heteroderae]
MDRSFLFSSAINDPVPSNPNVATLSRTSNSPREAITATASANNNNNGGGFAFIVGNTPAEMKSKKHMTIVRKAAMRSYLENEKGDKRNEKKTRLVRVMSEDSTGSKSGVEGQDATIINVADDAQIHIPRKQSKSKSRSPAARKSPSPLSHEQILEAGPLVEPMRITLTLPYDAKDTPLFSSLGQNVDPFKTMFQSAYPRVSVEKLKFLCARVFGTRAMGRRWIPTVLSTPHTYLSTLCVASAHYDAILDRKAESIETISLRTEIIHILTQNLLHPVVERKVDDFNITTLIQLICSEVVGRKEIALDIHEKGLEDMINVRGGLSQLGLEGYLAHTISWVLVESAVLRERRPRSMFLDHCAANSRKEYPANVAAPESPLYRPRRHFETLKKSKSCRKEALELLEDVLVMTEHFLKQAKSARRQSETLLHMYRKIVAYPTIAELQGTGALKPLDHKYEAIRLTAILQATAMVKRTHLSEAVSAAAFAVSQRSSPTYSFSAPSQRGEAPSSPLSPLDPRHDPMTGMIMTSTYTNSNFASPSNATNCRPTFSVASMATSRPSIPSTTPYSSVASTATSHPSMTSLTSHQSVSSVATSHPSMSEISENWPFVPLEESRPSRPSGYSASDNPFFPFAMTGTRSTTTAFLTELKQAIFDSNLSDCWHDMGGVLMWIGLTVGAATHKHEDEVLKKWYSALALRASVILCFEHPQAVHSTVLKMSEVIEALSAPETSSTAVEKRRKTQDRT